MNLSLKELQQEATTYLIGTTTKCGHTLSKAIAQAVASSEGNCFTIVPPSLSDDHLYKFGTGGLYVEDRQGRMVVPVRNDTTAMVEKMIMRFFDASKQHCAIAEDSLFKATDAEVQHDSDHYTYLMLGEELYFFNSNQHSVGDVMFTLKESDASYYSFFALLSLPIKQQLRFSQSRYHMQQNDILLLASSVQGIIQHAYDGESYLFWDRDGALLTLANSILCNMAS